MYESRNTEVPEGVLDLTLPEIPPRSRLHSLEPIGLRTSQVESLTSYIIRLAESHSVSVGSLYLYELYPLVKKLRAGGGQAESGGNGAGLIYDMRISNGTGSWAKVWVQAVEDSTLRSDHRLLTTLPWGSDFARHFKLRKRSAWCPTCYSEWWKAGKVVYTPLTWMLRTVNVCTTHRRFLENACPHCRRQPHIFASRSRSGYCSRCGNWLGSKGADGVAANSVSPEELNRQTWYSTAVCEWVAFAQGLRVPPTKEEITGTITELIRQVAGGNGKKFAHMIGVRPETVYTWLRKWGVPQMDMLLKICSKFGLTLTGFLTGQSVSDWHPSADRAQTRLPLVESLAPPYKKADVVAFLKAALEEYPAPSLPDLAARLGYKSADPLRNASPELSRSITARRRALSPRKGRPGYFVRDAQTVRSALEAALEMECPPSVDEMGLALKYKCVKALRKRFPDLCRRISVKRADSRRKSIRDGRKILEGALEEMPPPSLREVARRLGANNANVVYRRFPDLSPPIVARHDAWKKSSIEHVRQKLNAVLEEETPRPMNEVARDFDLKEGTLRKRYKELCRQISARYAAYSQRTSEERKRLVIKAVREVAVKLIERGLHPSEERVRPLLKEWQGDYNAERTVTLRSIRREFGLPDRGYPLPAKRS